MLDQLLLDNMRGEFDQGLTDYTPTFEDVATVVTSTKGSDDFGWLGNVPRMRLFNGERIPVKLSGYKYSIDNDEYEASVALDMKDIEDDTTGKYLALARQIGTAKVSFPDEIIYGTILPGGFANLAYDGQYFFDSDHNIGLSGNQSNLITAKLGPTGFNEAINLFYQFKDDQGRPINPNLDLEVVVPWQLRATAAALFDAKTLSGGADNPNYKAATWKVNPWLTDANQWYVINKTPGLKPFVFVKRLEKDLQVLGNTSPTGTGVINESEAQFMNRKVYVGTFARYGAGYGLFQKAVGSTGSTGTQGA